MVRPVVVLACGDALRGDDGIAAAAVRALPPRVLELTEVRVLDAPGVEDLVDLPPDAWVVIVDAVAGPPPGQLVELDLAALRALSAAPHGVAGSGPVASSHQLPLPEVVALAGLLRGEPLLGRFVGVGIRSVAFGEGFSEPVAAALPALTAAVAHAVHGRVRGASPARGAHDTLTPMSERSVDVPGGRLAVHDFGAGPAFVLLHAGVVDAWSWEPLTPFLLDAGYRVVAYDRRGIGDSVSEDVEFSERSDLVAVLDALGIERACLVGNSIGGMIAIDTAVEFPERVAALATIGAGLAGYWVDPTPEEDALFDAQDRLEADGDPEEVADFQVRLWLDGPNQPPDRVPVEIRDLVRDMALGVVRAQRDPLRPQGRPIRLDPPAGAQLGRLTMPVLAIAGALDVSDVAAVARHLETEVPSARALIMPGVAHLIGLEAPEELARALLDLMEPLGRW